MIGGSRNREVEIQRRTVTRDPKFKTQIVSWSTFATVWASVQDMLPSKGETIAEGLAISNRPARVRMLYRDGLDATMRLVVKAVPAANLPARTLEIVGGPAEIGFREGIEFVCQDFSTKGEAP